MPQLVEQWMCGVCKTIWPTRAEAQTCESRGKPECRFKVGDIVEGGHGFGWHDGQRNWVVNPGIRRKPSHGNCFGSCCTMGFYYVVTVVDVDDKDGHRSRYHVFTKAMSGKQGHRSGYTYESGHITLRKARRHPKLDTSGLLGQKARCLL